MPSDDDYRQLLAFRTRLREFERWSRSEAEALGVTHAHHQLLLAVRGLDSGEGPTVGAIADALLVKHHTAGELIDRAQAHGLVARVRDEEDHRRVRVRLTKQGRAVLGRLTDVHLAEVQRLAALFPFQPPDPVPSRGPVGSEGAADLRGAPPGRTTGQ